MLGLLIAGFGSFLLRRERLMVVSLVCCCILCLHLKSSANKQMRLAAVTTSPSLSISHINLANAENDYDSVVNYLLSLKVDFISFQELTPDWNAELSRRLIPSFQYNHTMTRLDQYGMGFFSKIPFESIDTIFFDLVPSLVGTIYLDVGNPVHILSCQVIPPVNQAAFSMIEQHFHHLSTYLKNLDGGIIVLGDLHLPPWSSEIQKFKSMSDLQDSRRDINPRNHDGSMSLPRIPVEHIFYSKEFECTSFTELGNEMVGRLGIAGIYQLQERPSDLSE